MTQKGNALTKEQIAAALTTLLDEAKTYKPKAYKNLKSLSTADFNWQFERAVNELFDLHEALLNDCSVWGQVERRGTGPDWYSVFYVKNNTRQLFWIVDFFPLFYAKEQNRNTHIRKWVWDGYGVVYATDYLFTFFKNLGGCYAQIGL